ncbi:MAG: ATP-binding cassette domain-containing protein, partial [Planctomycetota bacterium]
MSLLIENLQHAYADPDGGRTPVLDIDHYELAKGEQAALVGSSGGGKTTLLNVIAGIRSPDAGRVLVDGHDVHALPEPGRDRLRAAKIGFVFQTFNLLPAFTAVENVLLGMSFTGGQADRGRALELLERVGLG